MARIRTIKPDFFKDEELSELALTSRLLFIGLWTLADREGRVADRPKRIKAEIFPYDNVNIEKGLGELSTSGFIMRYEAERTGVIEIKSFLRHQIPGRDEPQSELPAQDGTKNEYIKPPNDTVRNRIYQRDNYICAYCDENLANKTRSRCLDHIIPYAKGGSNHESNLITSCKRCNTVKGCRTPEEAGMRHPVIGGVNGGLTDANRTVNGFVTGKGIGIGRGNGIGKGIEREEGADALPPKFVKPDEGLLTNYFTEIGLDDFSAQAQAGLFLNHYDSNGWKVGKNSMKDWHAAARGWKDRMKTYTNATRQNSTPGKSIVFDQA